MVILSNFVHLFHPLCTWTNSENADCVEPVELQIPERTFDEQLEDLSSSAVFT